MSSSSSSSAAEASFSSSAAASAAPPAAALGAPAAAGAALMLKLVKRDFKSWPSRALACYIDVYYRRASTSGNKPRTLDLRLLPASLATDTATDVDLFAVVVRVSSNDCKVLEVVASMEFAGCELGAVHVFSWVRAGSFTWNTRA
ncbi:hypothetical protein OGATHE_004517 [Ogataea polymorpha]|uniref:Uncharacterized protein n=1 Tax=Ogataea polymorpha TaxID=460523 RepID=A0A9P8T1V2_9ASCO|nr:hypothetical protein OGATHE_004517 [Ogataea polymorpha]